MKIFQEESYWKWVIEILSVYVQIPICIIGCILNIVNFAIFAQQHFSSATYVLITALSLTDGVTLLLRIGQGLIRCSSEGLCRNPHLRFFLYIFIIFLDIPITNTTENISAWLTMALAIERCLTMRWNHLSRMYCTVHNTRNLIIILSILAVILNLPFFFTISVNISIKNGTLSGDKIPVVTSQWTGFAENSSYYTIHSWTRTALVQYIPLIFLCLSSVLLLTFLRSHNRHFVRVSIKRHQLKVQEMRRSKGSPNDSFTSCKLSNSASQLAARKQKAQKKLTILLIIVISLFLVCQIPHGFAYVKIYQTFGICPSFNCIDECLEYQMFRTITMILTLLGYSVNFFVYFILNIHFRESFFRFFRSKDSEGNTEDRTDQIIDSNEFHKMTKLYLFPLGKLTYRITQPGDDRNPLNKSGKTSYSICNQSFKRKTVTETKL